MSAPHRSLVIVAETATTVLLDAPAREREPIEAVELIDADAVSYYLAARRPAWMDQAACVRSAVDFFPRHGSRHSRDRALAVCRRCSVREDCLAYALSFPVTEDAGIYGGTTAAERRKMRDAGVARSIRFARSA